MEYYKKRIMKKGNETIEIIQPSNGGTVCDCWNGPCSCGAWHSLSDEYKDLQKHAIEVLKFFTKLDLLLELGYEFQNFNYRHLSGL